MSGEIDQHERPQRGQNLILGLGVAAAIAAALLAVVVIAWRDGGGAGDESLQGADPDTSAAVRALIASSELNLNVRDPSPNYPRIRFVTQAGATRAGELTHGPFVLGVLFDPAGGARIVPDTFECYVTREIRVGNKSVAAETMLTREPHKLWEVIEDKGALWVVDQVEESGGPSEEFVPPGALMVGVRVANEYGFYCSWVFLKIYTQAKTPGMAFTGDDLLQGGKNHLFEVNCAGMGNADWIWFDDPGVTVVKVDKQVEKHTLIAVVDVAPLALIGTQNFRIGNKAKNSTVASGTYEAYGDPFLANARFLRD
jgi:hypothetical protein